jgi:predicted nuclease of restriction endonuclease-like (RecB) superfamily
MSSVSSIEEARYYVELTYENSLTRNILLNFKEYFIDLLLFNRKIHSLVAIDLKIGEFEPEFIGKMNYYLGLLDDKLKQKDENPSIGIIMRFKRKSRY